MNQLLNILKSETCIICGLSSGDTFFRQAELLRIGNLGNPGSNFHLNYIKQHTCRSCLVKLPFLYPENTWLYEETGLEIKTLFSYCEPINHLLLALKFYHRRDLAKWFAHILYIAAMRFWHENKNSQLVPIPLGKRRQSQRGYNQTAEITKYLSEFTGIRYSPDLLIRNRETKRQTETKNRAGRLANIKGAFSLNQICFVNREKSNNKSQKILLFDDVSTTGITLAEAATTLQNEGYRVQAVVVATEHELNQTDLRFS